MLPYYIDVLDLAMTYRESVMVSKGYMSVPFIVGVFMMLALLHTENVKCCLWQCNYVFVCTSAVLGPVLKHSKSR